MTSPLKVGIAALFATVCAITAANALDLKDGGAPKLKPTKAQLGIISPPDNICPGAAKLTAWVFTNKPGTVDILIVRDNGQVTGPFAVTTHKGAGGMVLGSYEKAMNIVWPIDAKYRVVVAGTDVASNWVPLTAEC